MDHPGYRPDPLVDALKARQARRHLATMPSHVLSVLAVVTAAVLLVVAAWRPWIEPFGVTRPAIKGDDADAAVASLLVVGAAIELIACAWVVWAMRRRGRAPRFLHLVSVAVSALGFVFWYQRLRTDQDRVTVFNAVPQSLPSQLGDGIYIAGAGLAVGVLALVIAVPAMRRVWLS